jgi:molybdopterin converting factor small subunit
VATLVKVTLHYGHPLTEITGKAREEVIVKKGSTVLSLLRNLATKYGDAFEDNVFSNYERNQVKKGIIISLNAKNISDETQKIKIEDNVFIGIFRPVGGG